MKSRIKKAGKSINYDRTILECDGRYFVWADWIKLEEVEPKYQEIEIGCSYHNYDKPFYAIASFK